MSLAEYIKEQRKAQPFPLQQTGAAGPLPPAQNTTPLAGYIKKQRKSRQMGGGRQQAKDYGLAGNIVKLPSHIENQGLYSLPENKSRWDNMVSSSVKGLAGGVLQAGEAVWQGLSGETGKANRAYYDYVMESAYNPQKAGQLNEYLEKKETASRNEKLNTDTLGYKLLESSEKDIQKATEGMGQVGQFMAGIGENVLRSAYLMPLYANPVTASIAPFIMAASAAGQKVKQQTDKGDTLNEALTRGAVTGGIEYFMDKTGMDSLAGLAQGKGDVAGNITRSIASQAGEEGLSYLADYAADRITKQPDARFDWKELGLDMLAGGLSGGILAGGGAAIGGINNMVNTAPADVYQNITPDITNLSTLRERQATVKAGKVTVIKSVYNGTKPMQVVPHNKTVPQVTQKSVDIANTQIEAARANSAETGKSLRNYLKDFYNRVFDETGGVRNIAVNGVTFEGKDYIVTVNKNAVGKAISDPNLTAEKLAVFDSINDIVANAEYVGSGNYQQHTAKKKNVDRYDYFETDVQINSVPYIVAFDVEVVPGKNNYRTHKVINEISLTLISSGEAGPVPAALDTASSFNNIIPYKNHDEQEVLKAINILSAPLAKVNIVPDSYYSQLATLAKTKQDTVYAAYATQLDRQIQQQMAKQNNTIVNTDKIAYNVTKEGDIYGEEKLSRNDNRGTRRIHQEIIREATGQGFTGKDSLSAKGRNERRFRNITDKQADRSRYERITSSPEFYAKNSDGKPILLFHGTNADFESFRPGPTDIGIHFGNLAQASEMLERKNGHRIVAVELDLKNPVYVGADDFGMQTEEGYFDLLYKASDLSDFDVEYIKQHSGKYNHLSNALKEETSKATINTEKVVGLLEAIDSELERYVGKTKIELSEIQNRELEKDLQHLGYDGIVYNNNNEGDGLSYAVFNNSQIKQISKKYIENKTVAESDTSYPYPIIINMPYNVSPQDKQSKIYAAYTADLDRQIQQEMAKQSANSRNNKISANSLHNIEKTSENNYNVNKEGDNYDEENTKSGTVQQNQGEIRTSTKIRVDGRRFEENRRGKTANFTGTAEVERAGRREKNINGKCFVYNTVAIENQTDIASKTKKAFEKIGIDADIYDGDLAIDGKLRAKKADVTTFENGDIIISNDSDIPIEEAVAHEGFHSYLKKNNHYAKDYYNSVLKNFDLSNEKTSVIIELLTDNYNGDVVEEIAAYYSGWLNNNDVEGLAFFDGCFLNESEVRENHKRFMSSITRTHNTQET